MNASIVDLRTKSKEILKALERRETVTLRCRGKIKGYIVPPPGKPTRRVQETEMFGMYRHHKKPVSQVMDELRGGRFRDL